MYTLMLHDTRLTRFVSDIESESQYKPVSNEMEHPEIVCGFVRQIANSVHISRLLFSPSLGILLQTFPVLYNAMPIRKVSLPPTPLNSEMYCDRRPQKGHAIDPAFSTSRPYRFSSNQTGTGYLRHAGTRRSRLVGSKQLQWGQVSCSPQCCER